MTNLTKVILSIVVLTASIWLFMRYQFASDLLGTWRADFPLDDKIINIPQTTSLKVTFLKDGKFVYEVKTFTKVIQFETNNSVMSSNKGVSSSGWTVEGTYKLEGKKITIRLGENFARFQHVDPFLVTNFGADEKTGHSFIEGMAQGEFEGLFLTLQPYKYHQKFYFSKKFAYQNKERLIQLPNPFLENLQAPPEAHEEFVRVDPPRYRKEVKDRIGDQFKSANSNNNIPKPQNFDSKDASPQYHALTPQEQAQFNQSSSDNQSNYWGAQSR